MARRNRGKPNTGALKSQSDSEKQTQQQAQQLVQVSETRVERHQGPLPSPETLAKYDEIVPGTAERIVKQAEAQTYHRHNLENMVVREHVSRSRWGLICGFIIALLFLSAAFVLVLAGHDAAGATIATVDIAGLVSTFLWGRRRNVPSGV